MAEPVPEPVEPELLDSPTRPALSPDPQQAWRPGPPRRAEVQEQRPILLRLESRQYVLLLMAIVAVIMLVMLGILVTDFLHAAQSARH